MYLIAVLPNRLKAEEAYTALETAGIPQKQLTILGRGYKSADEFGLIDPNQVAKKRALLMAAWLVPFGFAAGFTFNVITKIQVFDWAGSLGNHIIGGVFGAIAGAMGGVFVGGGVGLTTGSGDALPYRNSLNAGKYLVIVSGEETLKNRARNILQQFSPETLQAYEPES